MNGTVTRKRSRLALEPDDDEPRYTSDANPSASLADLKRTRTQGDLDDIDVIPPENAWTVDVDSIMSCPTLKAESAAGGKQVHSNLHQYKKGSSIVVLCVQGDLPVHYDILCGLLPELYALSPSLQALVLCRDPATHVPSASTATLLPFVRGVGSHHNHFIQLGLSHPLGGDLPLDALVVLDGRGRRRLVLPFGWGGGRYAIGHGGGVRVVRTAFVELLKKCVSTLVQEGT
ncbi:uncharacterized protein EI97DRAFT_368336 [Westerdykella ornata]|uniref:Uncharacterized protein n=1 Tax=Westerdykella ornata TaxID=318751 RepID=A0A6A6JY37_WESOR|nr:uncharacterized protein EI97DRAFT_368336 [Westerdykella ornata]KAF2281003.1 hypothetical protein EI97DRAFT_368336 [Westerdykella ornata]